MAAAWGVLVAQATDDPMLRDNQAEGARALGQHPYFYGPHDGAMHRSPISGDWVSVFVKMTEHLGDLALLEYGVPVSPVGAEGEKRDP